MAQGSTDDGAGVSKLIRDALKRIRDAVAQHSGDRDAFNKHVGFVAECFANATGGAGELELQVSTNRIMWSEDEVYKSESRTGNLAFDLFRQGVRRLVFRPGVSHPEIETFLDRFAHFCNGEFLDDDLVSTLWRDALPNIELIAIDGFTEKIFMSDQRFVGRFKSVLNDIMPDVLSMPDEELEDAEPRVRETCEGSADADKADLEQRKIRKQLGSEAVPLRNELVPLDALVLPTDQLLQLFVRTLLRDTCPLSERELQQLAEKILASYLAQDELQAFADALRSLYRVTRYHEHVPEAVGRRLLAVQKVIAGREMADHVSARLNPEKTDFTAWVRWFFVEAELLSAPALLELINICENRAGTDWLKDLLRRQGTASLDPWAERLRDPNPGVVIEVIDVIMNSDLGAQAQPLLLETLKHDEGMVRRRAIDALEAAYDLQVREALLPYLKDPDSQVRRAVIGRFVSAEDNSVAPYIANIIRSGEIFAFDEDEQREFFVALAKLGGQRFFDVFAEKLDMEEAGTLDKLLKRAPSAMIDNPTRRGAISGLAKLGTNKAQALIKQVQARADLALAAHCDVMVRLAQRGEVETIAPQARRPDAGRVTLEDVEIGRNRMGDRFLFLPQELGLSAEDPITSPPSDIPAEVGAAQTPWSTPPQPTGPELGDRPLLNHTEVFEPFDQIKLEAKPETMHSPRFRLISVQTALVGITRDIPQLSDGPASIDAVASRIVEKKTSDHAHDDWRYHSAESVDDMLQRYLEQEKPKPNRMVIGSITESSRRGNKDNTVDEILTDYLGPDAAAAPAEAPESETDEGSLEDLLKGYVDDESPDTDDSGGAVASAPDSVSEDERPDSDASDLEDAERTSTHSEEPPGTEEDAPEDSPDEDKVQDLLRSYLEEDGNE